MQTMTSDNPQAPPLPIRLILLLLCAISMIGAFWNLSGDSPIGLFYLVPLAMVFLLLRILAAQERAQAKKKAPGRSAWPGAGS